MGGKKKFFDYNSFVYIRVMSQPNKEWRKRNPEKVRAHWIVSNAIRYGKLTRKSCEICGNEKSHAHHNDYSKPLEIEWLCHKCHWQKHGWIAKPKKWEGDGRTRERTDTKKHKLKNKAIKLRNKGLSYRQIGLKLRTDPSLVYKWINNTSYN